jgi:hypothetical protein
VELIQLLMTQLGINEQQAKAGLGAILQLAQTKLSPETISEVNKLLPNLADLLKAAPASGGGLGALGSLLGGQMAQLAKLAGQFSQLGLAQSQLTAFAQLVFEFLSSKLPPDAKDELINLARSLRK